MARKSIIAVINAILKYSIVSGKLVLSQDMLVSAIRPTKHWGDIMEGYDIIIDYLRKEHEKKKEIEAINIDDYHKNIILAGVYQNISSANSIKKDLVTLFKYQNVFEILKPMINVYTMENPYEGTEDYILSILDTTTHLTKKQYITIKELMLWIV